MDNQNLAALVQTDSILMEWPGKRRKSRGSVHVLTAFQATHFISFNIAVKITLLFVLRYF